MGGRGVSSPKKKFLWPTKIARSLGDLPGMMGFCHWGLQKRWFSRTCGHS